MKKLASILMFPLLLAQPALAAQTDWATTEGGAMRLVITDDGEGSARGVLDIKLNPGWKTYWRDPGDGGIPPTLTGDGMAVELQFPAPERISENGSTFSGYHGSVSLPFILPETLMPVYKVTAFVGICSDICVPFQAEFPLTRDSNDTEIVNAAFAKLPKPAGIDEGVVSQLRHGEFLELKTKQQNATLFLAPARGVYFGIPESNGTDFKVKVLKEKTPGVKVFYTLTKNDGAVSGTFTMPN
jgi:DsbC/DsbD-like thiol-disulfide interchange protein